MLFHRWSPDPATRLESEDPASRRVFLFVLSVGFPLEYRPNPYPGNDDRRILRINNRWDFPMGQRALLLATTLLLSSLTLIGCREIAAPEESLTAARELWREAGPAYYTMTMRISCECNADESGPIVAIVRNGALESRRYVSTGELVPEKYSSRFLTVEGLFDMVERQLQRDVPDVTVQYDRDIGYPARVEFPGQVQQDVYTVSILKN